MVRYSYHFIKTKPKYKKIFRFNKKKKDKFIKKTPYTKFLNILVRKGFKSRYITFFYKLMRLHKKKLNLLKQTKKILKKNYEKIFSLRFSVLFQRVLNLVRINLELKYRKYRKKEILIPSPVAPWKGLRLGLNLLFKNAQNSLLYTTKPRKLQPLYKLLTEMWDTFYGYSLTCQNILDFTNKVIDNFENYKSAQIFCVRKDRYNIFEKKVVIAKPKKKNTIHRYLRHMLYLRNKSHKFFPESIKGDKELLRQDRKLLKNKNQFKFKKKNQFKFKKKNKFKFKFKKSLNIKNDG